MDTKQAHPLFVLIATALVPFALVCCSRASSSTPSDTSSNAVTATNDEAGAAIASSAPSAANAPDAGAVIRLNLGAQNEKRKCEQIRRTMGAIIATSRDCVTDADCTQITTSCGLPGVCGASVNKSNEAKIRGEQKPWEDLSCALVVGAPCPTCAMPPAPKCVEGKCE